MFSFRIHPSLPLYTIKPVFDIDIVGELTVYRAGSVARWQTLDECEVIDSPPKGERWLKTEDLNFDGFEDLLLLAWWGATGNQSWCVWLFDPPSGKFRYVRDFSLGAHVLNPKDKSITVSANGGGAGGIADRVTVRFIGARPVMVKQAKRPAETSVPPR